MDAKKLLERHHIYYQSKATRSVGFRLHQLETLQNLLQEHESEFFEALKKDFNKPEFETFGTELGLVLSEISHVKKHLKKWVKPTRVSSELINFPSRNRIISEPYGTVLIISPWNYPVLLSLLPLIGAIAAGNTVVLKPSEISAHTSALLSRLFKKWFKEEYLKIIEGGADVSQNLIAQKFDYIFFTGSPRVGKIIMETAAKNLVPVTLELGGKSPVIVDETADLKVAARRVAWGKLVNAGQTCVAPDYLLVQEDIKPRFLDHLKDAIIQMYGVNARLSPDFARIVNDAHFNRIQHYLKDGTIFYGGKSNAEERFIEPTILTDVDLNAPVMQEEIFGPVLPVIPYKDIYRAVELINSKEKPLALYLFTKNEKNEAVVMDECSFGGGAINDTIAHLGNRRLGIGGVGFSGMGSYHGKKSFDTFSHQKAVMKKPFWADIPVRYPPYNNKLNLIKRILR